MGSGEGVSVHAYVTLTSLQQRGNTGWSQILNYVPWSSLTHENSLRKGGRVEEVTCRNENGYETCVTCRNRVMTNHGMAV